MRQHLLPLLAGWWLVACLWVGASPALAQAQTEAAPAAMAALPPPEMPIDERSRTVAQVVFGILGYTRWPVEPPALRICVVGPTEYADELIKGGHLHSGVAVTVRRMKLDDMGITSECHGVYAGMVPDDAWRQLLGRLANQPLLTISERKALCRIGGMFCLDVQATGVGFEVHLDSVARSGVRVNPRVLQLARRKSLQ